MHRLVDLLAAHSEVFQERLLESLSLRSLQALSQSCRAWRLAVKEGGGWVQLVAKVSAQLLPACQLLRVSVCLKARLHSGHPACRAAPKDVLRELHDAARLAAGVARGSVADRVLEAEHLQRNGKVCSTLACSHQLQCWPLC